MDEKTKAALDAFVAQQQAVIDENEKNHDVRIPKTVLAYEVGQRYARLFVSRSAEGKVYDRSAYGFVDLATGDLLKAASWKAPAKNFARGNIFKGSKFGPYGIS